MDDIVKMRRNSCGKFYMSKMKIVTDINILEKQRGSRDYLGQRICVLGNEEDSFLN